MTNTVVVLRRTDRVRARQSHRQKVIVIVMGRFGLAKGWPVFGGKVHPCRVPDQQPCPSALRPS